MKSLGDPPCVVSRRAPGSALALSLLGLLAACGAKTGLNVPDAGLVNPPDPPDPTEPDPICVEVPFEGAPIELPLDTVARVSRADVLFLVDTTQSMEQEIGRIQDRLRDRLSPGISATIGDTELGVATFADFGVDPHGERGRDVPFELLQPMTSDLAAIQAAVNSIDLGSGRDEPESQVEALYQVATGEGNRDWIPPSFGCPSGGFGYPCFREDAVPVVLLFTDAPFHNGPGGVNPYSPSVPAHTYDEAVRELNARDIYVIGINSSADSTPREHLRRVARDTGAVDARGEPIVFDIGVDGRALGDGVIGAIETFANDVIQDISVELRDPTPRDGVDVRDFVLEVVPLRAEPPDGVAAIDRATGVFVGVRGGTTVVYQLVVRNDAVVPGDTPRVFPLDVIFRGDGRTQLARRTVLLVIPAADGSGCDDVDEPR